MRVTEPYTIFPRKLASGKTVYYYQYRTKDGKRMPAKSTGCETLSKAKRFCNKLYNEGKFEKTSSPKFIVFTNNFFMEKSDFTKWKTVNNQKVSKTTLLRYNQLLEYQLLPYFSDFQLSSITRQDIKDWIIWASERWSPKTVNNAQTVLNLILNQAIDKELIKFNPASNLCFRKIEKKNRQLLTIDEIKSCYNSNYWNEEIMRKAFLLTSITGMRIGEVSGLRNSDIHTTYIDVNHSYNITFGIGATKTKQNRKVPIPENFHLANSNSEWAFASADGKPFNSVRMLNNLHKIWNLLGINYEKRNLTTHTLRNFFISYLQKENVTESKIRAVVGHKDSSMTGLYTYWQPEMLKEVYIAQQKLYNKIIGAN